MDNFIDNLKKTYCRIGVSKIHGIGVIAIRDIPKGTNPFQFTDGECPKYKIISIHKNKLKKEKIHKNIVKMIEDFIHPVDNYYSFPFEGLNSLDITFFMNHSDNPNMKYVENTKCEFVTFRAIKKIKENDELTINYNKY